MRWPYSRWRAKIALFTIALLAGLAFIPLRLAIIATGKWGSTISARQVSGSIWRGQMDQLMLGGITLGTVEASVSPFQLLMGRVRIDLWRKQGRDDDFSGAWIHGFGQNGIDDVSGNIPAGTSLAPLPVSMLEFQHVTADFVGDTCVRAQGRLRLRLSSQYAGLNLSGGFSGAAECDGTALLFPLMSQTGMERLSLRIWRDGRYNAQLAIKGDDAANAASLSAAGLIRRGEDYVLNQKGRL